MTQWLSEVRVTERTVDKAKKQSYKEIKSKKQGERRDKAVSVR